MEIPGNSDNFDRLERIEVTSHALVSFTKVGRFSDSLHFPSLRLSHKDWAVMRESILCSMSANESRSLWIFTDAKDN